MYNCSYIVDKSYCNSIRKTRIYSGQPCVTTSAHSCAIMGRIAQNLITTYVQEKVRVGLITAITRLSEL